MEGTFPGDRDELYLGGGEFVYQNAVPENYFLRQLNAVIDWDVAQGQIACLEGLLA